MPWVAAFWGGAAAHPPGLPRRAPPRGGTKPYPLRRAAAARFACVQIVLQPNSRPGDGRRGSTTAWRCSASWASAARGPAAR